jgi:hypothetical protein
MMCPRCRTPVAQGDLFCTGCGFDLRTAGTCCAVCGAASVQGDSFCAACGTALEQPGVAQGTVGPKASASAAATEEAERPAGKGPAVCSGAGGMVFTHGAIRDIAASYRCNTISPLSALNAAVSNSKSEPAPIDKDLLDGILTPSKAFYLTAGSGGTLSQSVLLTRDSVCWRWIDAQASVTVSREKRPREFISYVYAEISRGVTGVERSVITLTREQIVILKAVNSLGSALTRRKVRRVFTAYDQLERFLKADDSLRRQLDELASDRMVRIVGDGNPIIALEKAGDEIVNVLEDHDAFWNIQVLTEGRDEFPSVYLVRRDGRLYMISNPGNGDDVVVRSLDSAGLRSILNWMWTADPTLTGRGRVAVQ